MQKRAPIVGFGKVHGNPKTMTAQWEDKIEKYIGMRPGENKKSPPKERGNSLSVMQTFDKQ